MMQDIVGKAKKFGGWALSGIGALAIILFFGGFLTGLSPSRSRSTPFLSENSVGVGGTLDSPMFQGKASGDTAAYSTPNAVEGQLTQRKVVKNGSLSLLVKNAEEVALQISKIAERFNGFVGQSNVYEVSAGVKAGSVTIRVPADRFSEAVGEVKKLAKKVERENVSAQDVTEQFVDLEAQIKNLRLEEGQYQAIMQRSGTIPDTLQVAQRLSDVRGRIERLQGQIQYLSRQVDMSTISVSLTAEADVEVFGIRWRPLFVIKQAFRDALSGVTGYIDWLVRFVLRLPVVALWLATIIAGVIIAWRLLRWVWFRFFGKKSGTV